MRWHVYLTAADKDNLSRRAESAYLCSWFILRVVEMKFVVGGDSRATWPTRCPLWACGHMEHRFSTDVCAADVSIV